VRTFSRKLSTYYICTIVTVNGASVISDLRALYFLYALVPIRAMTGLCANGDIRPKNWFQKVSIFGPLYLSQKWWRSCKEAKHMYL
jgi:hypothetical protein